MEGHFMRDGGDSTIHLSNKRHEDVVAQLQLTDISRRTPSGLHVFEHLSLHKQSHENELLKRQMLAEFVPQPPKRQRRMKPMFQEKMKSKELHIDQYLTLPRVPAYSPVDPAPGVMLESRSRKQAYINKRLVTTADLKKPHISSLGVIPVRSSAAIPNLRVILEGIPAAVTEEEVEPRLCNTPVVPFVSPELPCEEEDSSGDYTSKKKREIKEKIMKMEEMEAKQTETTSTKPAILPKVGTAVTVKLFQREKPAPKLSYLHGRRKQGGQNGGTSQATQRPISAQSTQSSLLSGEINFNDEYDGSGDVETAVRVADRMHIHSSKDGSVASVEELLEEARKISSSESDPLSYQHDMALKGSVAVFDRDTLRKKKHSQPSQPPESNKKLSKEERRKEGAVSDCTSTGVSTEEGKVLEEDICNSYVEEMMASEAKFPVATEVKRGERTVDEIIASLRDQSVYTRQTDADLRIKQIMDRVTARTTASSSLDLEGGTVGDTENTAVVDEVTATGTNEGQAPSLDLDPAVSPDLSPDFLSQIIESLSVDSNTMTLSGAVSEVFTDDLGILDRKTEENDGEWLSARTQTADVVPVWAEEFEVASEHDQMPCHTEGIDQPRSIQQVWEDLLAPPEATLEDILNVRGEMKEIHRYRTDSHIINPKSKSAASFVSLLSTWTPGGSRQTGTKQDRKLLKNIHHFCCMNVDDQLPQPLMHVGRKYHTPDRFPSVMPDQPYRFKQEELATLMEEDTSSSTSTARIEDAASRVVQEVNNTMKGGKAGNQQEMFCPFLIGELDLSLTGEMMQIRTDETQLYWSPAPPKLGAAPHKVQEMLFPQYYLEELDEFGQIKITGQKDEQSYSSEEEDEETISPEDKAAIERTILKRHNSAENVAKFRREQAQGEEDMQDHVVKSEGQAKLVTDVGLVTESSGAILQEDKHLIQRRPQTAPSCASDGGHHSILHDVNSALNEIREQKRLLEQAKKKMQRQETTGARDEIIEQKEAVSIPGTQNVDVMTLSHKSEAGTEAVVTKLTPAEKALQAGRKYVILPNIKKTRRHGKKLDIAKMKAVEKMLKAKPTGRLLRHTSLPKLNRVIEREMKVPWKIRVYRASIPNLLDFDEYKTSKRMPTGEDEREWVRGIWNNWFDQVFPPTPEDSDNDDVDFQDQETTDNVEKEQLHTEVVNDILSQDVTEIEPILDTPENREIYQILLEEIEKLSSTRDRSSRLTAFDFCRRGALYRKIGQLKKAEKDLDRAIHMEPDLLDAYWHRHLLYILQDRKAAAMDDLKFILNKNKHHAGAHRSMFKCLTPVKVLSSSSGLSCAEFYLYDSLMKCLSIISQNSCLSGCHVAEINKQQNDATMAIINYSYAIKVNPHDHEAYFQRAQMYEERGDMLLAMEDYAKAMKIMPSRTDVIMKHAMYYFENGNWQSAINDFTQMLKVDPLSATAYLYRGQAYTKLNKWVSAVQDFSCAIHHDPHNWQAFYLRACILRKAHPRKAVQDFSISLLLNDTEDNYLSYLHRGILYDTLRKPVDAIADFESVLKLQKNLAAAHVNIGLIYMSRLSNVHRAIQKFTVAISVDPTYVRGYVCRAEAYHKIHEVKKSLKDITRAIHMRPDMHHYYMYRGQFLLELGNLDLAAFCVHHASEMSADNPSSTLGELPAGQAVVQAFLKNYDKAVEVLDLATRTKPVAPYFMLLARTHMKAKQFQEAVASFKEALDKMKPWQKEESWPPETADTHYQTGLCYMELGSYSEAQQHFNLAIKFNPSCADAYYQRGLACVKLHNLKGILDFNRALALDPTMFQAYLSRACYYGMKGKYAKAILNCNEAIKLQPESLRAYLYRGSLKYHIKAYELAIMDLTKASSIDTQCPLPYFNRAVCYHETGQFDQSLTDYSIVLMLGGMLELKVLINRGLLYFERQDYMNALFDLQAAAKISPLDHTVIHTLGLCLHKLNQLRKAVAAFTRCLQLKPFFLDGFIARGNAFMDYENEQGLKFAKRDYQRVLHLDPLCLPARVNLAYAVQVSGKMMQAWKHFTSIIEVRPGYKPALEGRAIVNLQMSNLFGAFQDISQSIDYGPTAELLTNRGVISQFMRDIAMAMQDYQRAIKLDPGYSLAYFNAGNVYFYNRHFKQALDYYTKAVKYNPKDESAFLNRAITKVLLHDTKGALEDFDVAVKLSPLSAHIYFNRANLYASFQQYDLAEKEYTRALELKPDDALMLKKRADVRGKLGKQADAIADYKRAVDIQTRPHKLIYV